jgi:5-formyltetrahydrofolate cyclo-ligase
MATARISREASDLAAKRQRFRAVVEDGPVMEPDKRALDALAGQAKRELRRKLRALRAALPASAVSARSARIAERVLELEPFRAARAVALFWPIRDRNEVDLGAVDAAARAQHKRVYYPFMDPSGDGYRTGFRRVDDVGLLAERGRGFAEPPPELPEAARGDVDLVIVPALAVAEDGHRLGYGAGFYDATLPDVCPPARSLVVAFAFQLVAELPPGEHDVACDWVVTDERTMARPF